MSPSARGSWLLLASALALGCNPVHSAPPDAAADPGGSVYPTPRFLDLSRVDLLFVVDDSPGMADAQAGLARAVPSLLASLATTNTRAGTPLDVHVAFIGTSLGAHGTSACSGPHADDHAHLLPRAGERASTGWTLDAAGAPTTAPCPTPVAASAVAWAYDPAASDAGRAEALRSTELAASCVVASAGADGCVFGAPLESMYHFLVDPAPYLTADVQCTTGPGGDACGQNPIVVRGVDQEILKERQAFLRPDSLLVVVMTSDRNDASLLPTGINWIAWAYPQGAMLRGWKGCEGVPDDFEAQTAADYATLKSTYGCQSCFQPGTDPAGNCAVPWASSALDADVDARTLRAFLEVRRFGFDFLWGRQRYVDAFASPSVVASDGTRMPNPILVGGYRTKDLVVVAGILGVPKALLKADAQGAPTDLSESDWDAIVSPDLARRDKHMIEQIAPRTALGMAKFAGDRSIDPVNGGDRDVVDGDDLQYACIGPRVDATATADCASADADQTNPLCQKLGTSMVQPYFKAYPSLRQLRVLHSLAQAGVPTTVASICDDRYDGAMRAIFGKLQRVMDAQCMRTILPVDARGVARCMMLESFAATASGALPTNPQTGAPVARCEDFDDGPANHGHCTPGTAPCRVAGTDFPPVDVATAAAQIVLPITVTDPATGFPTTESVAATAAPDGNVYAIGADGRKHLVCEMLQLVGNPAIDPAEQAACEGDPTFAIDPANGGGWCYSRDPAVIGDRCVGAGSVATIRFLGVDRPHAGSEVRPMCVAP